jgi:hypothetical protein
MKVLAFLAVVFVAGSATTARAQAASPEYWIGEWTGTVHGDFGSDEEGGRTTSKYKVHFAITMDASGQLVVSSYGGVPSFLPEGSYAGSDPAGELTLNPDAATTVVLTRKGTKLLYSGVADRRGGGTETATLSRRSSSGINTCDNVIGIRLAAMSCSAFPANQLPDLPNLKKISKLRGKAKKRQQEACFTQIMATREAMSQAGCAGVGP